MTLNDFKAVEGDRLMGVHSLPVQLGIDGAARTASWSMALPQIGVIGLLFAWQQPWHGVGVLVLLLGQVLMMRWFLRDPSQRALAYSGFGVPLFVAGMMVSAFALGSLN
jgi:chlorophyll synthase